MGMPLQRFAMYSLMEMPPNDFFRIQYIILGKSMQQTLEKGGIQIDNEDKKRYDIWV